MSDIHARAKQGLKLLMGRQVLLQILTFGGGIVLARVLGPAQFGLYAISTFLVSAFALFGDFGLAPSFIQRKEELTELDLRVGFTLQQIITTVIVALLFVAAPWLAHLYPKAPLETVWLVRTLAFSLYLTSWRSMSALQLERHMRYDRLAWIEVVETLSYQGLAVGLAVAGYGVWSFVWATMVRGVLGTLLVYLASPWPVRFGFSRVVVADILRFGVPFQFQNFVHAMGTWTTPTLVGSVIGPQAVGFLMWASSNGKKPLVLVDNMMRVAFPHLSRIQEDRAEVERIVIRYLTCLLLPSGLWFVIILIAGPLLVKLIYTDKWMPAVPALVLSAFALLPDIFGWVFGVMLNSMGRVSHVTRVCMVRSIANIALTVLLVFAIGFNGVPVAYLITISVTNIWLIAGVGRDTSHHILSEVKWVVIPIAVSAVIGEATMYIPYFPLLRTLVGILTCMMMFTLVTWLAGPPWIRMGLAARLARLSVIPPNKSRVSIQMPLAQSTLPGGDLES